MRGAAQSDWLLWQLADSAFPTGGFAHSGGLEAAYQYGEVTGRDDLLAFLQAALRQCGSSSLPFVAAVFDRTHSLDHADAFCDAFTSNHVANRASRLQGRAFVNSAARAFALSALAEIRDRMAESESPAHFAPVFGEVTRLLGLERVEAFRLFLFTQLRGWISSAVRLNIVGPIEAQSIQGRVSTLAEEVLQACSGLSLDDAVQTAPLLDLFQNGQERLYSRLFQS